MRIIYNKTIPPKGYVAVNIFGIIFAKKEHKPLSRRTINHERIHTAQMKELLYVFFYLLYAIEWLILLGKYRNTNMAYREIRFEKEAYKHEVDADYLNNRKQYSWIKY